MRVIMVAVFLLSMIVSAWTDHAIVAKAEQITSIHLVQLSTNVK